MLKIIVWLIVLGLTGCTGFAEKNTDLFYERQAELEAQCRDTAHEQFPGYPRKRGVLINYWFTRAYDQCLEKKALN